MKTLVLAAATGLSVTSAYAHTSLVPHEHPHLVSMLPDVLAVMLAALLVGIGFVVLRRFRKG